MQQQNRVPRWDVFELALAGPADGNPFDEVELSATFRFDNRQVRQAGFYDGDGTYRIRFMPDVEGEWSYAIRSNAAALDGQQGRFTCIAARPGVHGPVQVRNSHHFAHADGTPYFPFGTTAYAWTHQPPALQEQTLQNLAAARFNKIRMGVFPKHYHYNQNEPLHRAFVQGPDGREDFSRFNVRFFRQFETQVRALAELGIEADVIIFHPYDRWGYCTMTAEQDFRYLRYLVARLAAHRNVWWSLANEYDFLLDTKPLAQWDRYFQIIEETDPYRHPKSIHNGEPGMKFDHRKPWVSHANLQDWDVKRTPEWRRDWGKPVVNDECEYEGDLPQSWGNISARELVHRFWVTVTRGGYAGHGETYMQPDDVLWWAKGGPLRGESWRRIGFLRGLIEEDVCNGLTPLEGWEWQRVSAGEDGDFRLIYFGEHQPVLWRSGLPADPDGLEIDLIDTWEMTVTPLQPAPLPPSVALRGRNGTIHQDPQTGFALRLPGKPYQAIRIRRRRG